MDIDYLSNAIRTKCRKGWVVTTDGRILGQEPADKLSEPRAVTVCRTKEIADEIVMNYEASHTKIYNCDRFGNPKFSRKKYKVVAVYLVPAKVIDDL